MPRTLKAEDLNSDTDPSVAKQWDVNTPKDQQWADLYRIIDNMKIGLLNTHRPNVGLVARSMAVVERNGPDFIFLANRHSTKFRDFEFNKECSITFQNSSSQDWISISGTATIASNRDPRINELYSPGTKAWFGDLEDGVHNGTANDPRMSLIEVKAKHITYWKSTVSSLEFIKEVTQAAITGKVATTGLLRHFDGEEIEAQRNKTS
jgi:general stress protein 26